MLGGARGSRDAPTRGPPMSVVQSGVAIEPSESEAIARLVERLVARFPQVPALTVERIVSSVHQAFDGAKVRHFVPLLVEHDAVTQLTALPQPSAGTAQHAPVAMSRTAT